MLQSRVNLLARQIRGEPTRYTSLDQEGAAVLTEPFLSGVQYYEAPTWQNTINDQIAAYESSPLSGWRWPGWVGVLLTLLGGLGIAITAVRAISAKDPVARVLLAWAAAGALSAFVVPFAWERYYLPWLLPLITLIGYACAWILKQAALKGGV